MSIAAATPDDPRREAMQRLVLVLAHVRREQRRKRKADVRLRTELDNARARFDRDVGLALDRWLASRGFW